MNKKRIGIVPRADLGDPNLSNMNDFYRMGNNYAKRIHEAGGIPVGLVPVDYWLCEEALEMCDGFLVQGGAGFYAYHYQVIHHAVTHGKRYLGICLGEQLIYSYFELRRRVEERGCEGDVVKAICDYRQEKGPDFSVLIRVPNHRSTSMPRGQEDVAKHDVKIVPGTLMHRVLGRDTMRVATFHHFAVPPAQELLTTNAWSASGDGVVEGVEYKDHILGIQGHPEVDALLPEFFAFLTQE